MGISQKFKNSAPWITSTLHPSPAASASVLISALQDFLLRLSGFCPENQSCLSNIFFFVPAYMMQLQRGEITPPSINPSQAGWLAATRALLFAVTLICLAKANMAEAPRGKGTSHATCTRSCLVTAFAESWSSASFLQASGMVARPQILHLPKCWAGRWDGLHPSHISKHPSLLYICLPPPPSVPSPLLLFPY